MLNDHLEYHLEFVYRLCLNPFILSFPFKTDIFGCIAYSIIRQSAIFRSLVGVPSTLEAPNGLKEILPANILQGLQNCSGFAKAAIGRWILGSGRARAGADGVNSASFCFMNGFKHIAQSLATACFYFVLLMANDCINWTSRSMPQASRFHTFSYNLLIFDLQTIDINQHGKASNIQALALPFSWIHPYVFWCFFKIQRSDPLSVNRSVIS